LEDSESGSLFIGGRSPHRLMDLKASELVEESPEEVDWEEQWSLFAENFVQGKAEIDLSRFGKKAILSLLPGPGFGDLSHPTTALMLEMMQERVEGEAILDIGTGSGILALSALLLGASSAIGLDIDAAVLGHARQNAKLNHLRAHFAKKLPTDLSGPHVCLLNMIFPEQLIALRFLHKYKPLAKLWITSGILQNQKTAYLEQTKRWGWKLEEERQKEQWLGFVFN
ncbi:MAG: 50S ribosomal protein L11 methyltransferase, partial [Chlamydiae bacterium]|nr:50S ribosomal protein L11 methyltransferase [Chlamydiota bacterium]